MTNHLRVSWRRLWKNRTESFIHLAGLSIGMAAAVLIMLWVQNEWSYDNYHPKADQLYRVTSSVPITPEETWVWETSPYALAEKAAAEVPAIEELALLSPATYNTPILRIQGRPIKEKKAAYVSSTWFRLFQYEFTAGSPVSFFSAPFSLLLTESAALRYFGNSNPIDQLVQIDTVTYQVRAIVKDAPSHSSFQYDVLMPLDALRSSPEKRKNDAQWGNFSYISFVRTRTGSTPRQVTSQLNRLLNQYKKDNKVTTSLLPIRELHFDNRVQSSSFVTGNRQSVYVFAILASLLVVVACINYVNLTTARASLRGREVSIRKIVGAPRASLFGQFITETVLTTLLAGLLTGILVQLSLPFFNDITGQQFKAPFTFPQFWLLITGTLATVTVLSGFYPALLLSSFHPLSLFKGRNLLRLKDVSLRKILVTTQFAVSTMLIAATLIIFAQLKYIQRQHSQFNREQVFSFVLPYTALAPLLEDTDKSRSFHQALRTELEAVPGIQMVASGNESILDIRNQSSGNANWAGRPGDYHPSMVRLAADASVPALFGLRLKEGRWFRQNDAYDLQHNFILNETAIQQFKIQQPVIGQWFTFNGDSGQIIGVMKDFHFRSLHEKVSPLVYHLGDNGTLHYYVKVAPQQAAAVLNRTEKIWSRVVPGHPFEYSFLDESFDKLYRAERKTSLLMTAFAGIALFISCLGLLGLAAFTMQRRFKEIGIRKVLGASVRSIMVLLSREFFILVVIAIVVATPVAWWVMEHWLQDFAYRISIGANTFLLAGASVALVTLLIVGLYGLRAALVNPASSLRNE